MDLQRILGMQGRTAGEVGMDGEVHGSILVAETGIYSLLDRFRSSNHCIH